MRERRESLIEFNQGTNSSSTREPCGMTDSANEVKKARHVEGPRKIWCVVVSSVALGWWGGFGFLVVEEEERMGNGCGVLVKRGKVGRERRVFFMIECFGRMLFYYDWCVCVFLWGCCFW